MEELLKQLSEELNYLGCSIENEIIYIYAEASEESVCPYCGKKSKKLHSRYERSFQDLPIQNRKVIIILENKKYFCCNPNCNHKTFAPKYDFLPYKGKRTTRLDEHILNIAVNCSTIATSKILKSEATSAGRSTVSRILKKTADRNR